MDSHNFHPLKSKLPKPCKSCKKIVWAKGGVKCQFCKAVIHSYCVVSMPPVCKHAEPHRFDQWAEPIPNAQMRYYCALPSSESLLSLPDVTRAKAGTHRMSSTEVTSLTVPKIVNNSEEQRETAEIVRMETQVIDLPPSHDVHVCSWEEIIDEERLETSEDCSDEEMECQQYPGMVRNGESVPKPSLEGIQSDDHCYNTAGTAEEEFSSDWSSGCEELMDLPPVKEVKAVIVQNRGYGCRGRASILNEGFWRPPSSTLIGSR